MVTQGEKQQVEVKETKQNQKVTTAKALEPQAEIMARGETWSYLGPYIPSINFKTGTYTSGFPEKARPLYEKLYQMQALLLPLKDSLEATIAVRKKNTYERNCYLDLEDMVKAGEI